MRMSDWSSDVCSSDLAWLSCLFESCDLRSFPSPRFKRRSSCLRESGITSQTKKKVWPGGSTRSQQRISKVSAKHLQSASEPADRKSVVEGKSVSVRVDLGGRRIMKKKKEKTTS